MSDHEPFELDSIEDLRERLAAAVDRADRFHQALVEAEKRASAAERDAGRWHEMFMAVASR